MKPDEMAVRAGVLLQVETEVEHILAASPSTEVADNLIALGLQLVDAGWSAALGPVLAAFDQVRSRSLARDIDLGWHSMLVGLYDFHRGRLQEAQEEFAQAVRAGETLEDADLTANSTQNLGNVLWITGDLGGAEAAFIRSNEVRPAADDFGLAKVLVDLASIYLDRGDLEKLTVVLDELEASASMRRRGADRSALLGLRGLEAVRQRRLHEAESLFRAGAEMARRRGVVLHEIPNLQNLGSVRVELGLPGKALRPLRRAVALASLIQDFRMLETAQRTLATALTHSGRYREAETVLTESAGVVGDGAGPLAQARVLADLGALYLAWQKPDAAIGPLQRSLGTFLATGDREWGTKTALNLALGFTRTDLSSRALEVVRGTGRQLLDDPDEIGELLETLGDVVAKDQVGSDDCVAIYRAALEEYGRRESRSLSDRFAEIASKLAGLGLHVDALGLFEAALGQSSQAPSQLARYQILNDRALSRAAVGDLAGALQDLDESLSHSQEAQDRAMQALCLSNISEMSRRAGDFERAVETAAAAVALARQLRNALQTSDALAQLGLAQVDSEDFGAASASFRETLRLAKRSQNGSAEAIALGGLGRIALARGHVRKAMDYFLRAVELESDEPDATHETETWGAIAECAARIRDVGRYDSSMQRLIDAVQKRRGPLITALAGMEASGAAWLEKGDVEHAADAFGIAIVLSAVESADLPSEELIERVARSVLAAFFTARRLDSDAAALEVALRAKLRGHLRRSARTIEVLIPMAREALSDRPEGGA